MFSFKTLVMIVTDSAAHGSMAGSDVALEANLNRLLGSEDTAKAFFKTQGTLNFRVLSVSIGPV